MIKITHNGRPFDPRRFAEEIEAHAIEMGMQAIEEKARGVAGSIIDPETGKHAVVFVDRLPRNRVGIRPTRVTKRNVVADKSSKRCCR